MLTVACPADETSCAGTITLASAKRVGRRGQSRRKAKVVTFGKKSFTAACEQAAGTLRLVGVSALPLGVDPAYGRALGAVLNALDHADALSRTALAKAKTRVQASRR